MRVLVVAVLVLALALPAPAAALVLDPPVRGPVLARFHAPTRYGPGHRGVDIGAPPGTSVRASAAGRVAFVGRVVDATWVTVDHGRLRTTVGPLATTVVVHGQRVHRGTVLGTSGTAHGLAAVHWSAREGAVHVDPLTVGRAVATLVPTRSARGVTDGARRRPGARVR